VILLPLGPHDGAQEIVKLTKTNEGFTQEHLIGVRFVPLLHGQAREL
jgi:protein-L-isoaspartate(D-aspartate) O-methyltransferase